MVEVYLITDQETVMPNRKRYINAIISEQRDEFIILEQETTELKYKKRQTMQTRLVYFE